MQRRRRSRWCAPGVLAAAAALVLAGLAGCGPGHGLTLGRVQGKVTYKGEPVRFGTVAFEPAADKGTDGPIAMGNIKEDGTYVLSTSDPGDGAVVGHHRISVVGLDPVQVKKSAEEAPTPDPEVAPQEVMKNRAKAVQKARRATSRATRAKAKEDTFTDRGGRTFRYVIPMKLGIARESGLEADVTRGSNTIDIEIAEDGTARVTK
jgi:hypothetical protein